MTAAASTKLKPHKGHIANWRKEHFDSAAVAAHYGEPVGLGFYIRGTFLNHPQFGFAPGSHTSWVTRFGDPAPDGSREIETRNSRYTLLASELADA